LIVGILLAGLFAALQAAKTDAKLETRFVEAHNGRIVAQNSAEVLRRVEQLARTDHIALLELCLRNCQDRYRDFQATFVKQERINGILGKEQWIEARYLDNPFSVALRWTHNAPRGDRVLYVEGRYDDRMLVRPSNAFLRALAPTVPRDPRGSEAMKSTLRPVSMFGFRRGMESLLAVYRQAQRNGDLKTESGGYSKVAGRNAIKLIRYLPPKGDYPCFVTEIHIDLEYLLPVCIKGFDWDRRLSSRYVYKDLRINVGMTERDFMPEKNDLKWPR
jgi:hypothetical protein